MGLLGVSKWLARRALGSILGRVNTQRAAVGSIRPPLPGEL